MKPTLPANSRDDDPESQEIVDRLADSFLKRHRRGERPSLSEYIERYPHLADRIRELFPAMLVMENLGVLEEDEDTQEQGGKASSDEPIPERIGDFQIVREIGHGGMGVVYEAVQETLGRRVALKILATHMLPGGKHLSRFQREAQAAARLHHPHIVPIFGVGEDAGIHYYAMQYIHGQSLERVIHELRHLAPAIDDHPPGAALESSIAEGLLTGTMPARNDTTVRDGTSTSDFVLEAPEEAASSNGPTPSAPGNVLGMGSGPRTPAPSARAPFYRSVAEIGRQVADALSYAHGEGVLHRDIKPSNLLLDARGFAWVADFGLAKSEGSDSLTVEGDVVGTFAYMAPERFDGWSDPRSDVYSLGITLYELATLTRAFEDNDRHRLIHRVLHVDPPRPRRIDAHIPRDLETIILTAIAKEPSKRYASASQLAEDLARFLAQEPIAARRSSVLDQGVKWARRRPAQAALALVSALAALVVLIGSLVYNERLSEALGDKNLHAGRAERNYARARDAVQSMLLRLGDKRLEGVPHMETVRRDLLEKARELFQSFLEERGDDPGALLDAVLSYKALGEIQALLGRVDEAVASYGAGVDIARELCGLAPGEPAHERALADAIGALAMAESQLNRTESAEAHIGEAVEIQERLHVADPESIDDRRLLATHVHNSGVMLLSIGRHIDAASAYRRAIELREGILRDRSDDAVRSALATSYNNLGNALRNVADATATLPEAEASFVKSIATMEELGEAERSRPETRANLASFRSNLALLYGHTGRHAEAGEIYERVLETHRAMARDFPSVPEHRYRAASVLLSLGLLAEKEGRYADAKDRNGESAEILEALTVEMPEIPKYAALLASIKENLATLHIKAGELDKSIDLQRQAVDLKKTLSERFPQIPDYRFEYGRGLDNFANALDDAGELNDAERFWKDSIAVLEELVGGDQAATEHSHVLGNALNNYSTLLMKLGRFDDAAKTLARSHEIRARLRDTYPAVPSYRAELAVTLSNLGYLAYRVDDAATAKERSLEAIDILDGLSRDYPEQSDYVYRAMTARLNLSAALSSSETIPEGIRILESGLPLIEALVGRLPENPTYGHILGLMLNNLAVFHKEAGDLATAQRYSERAVDGFARLAEKQGLPQDIVWLSRASGFLAVILEESDQQARCREIWGATLDRLEALVRKLPRVADYRAALALVVREHGEYLERRATRAEALSFRRRAADFWGGIAESDAALPEIRLARAHAVHVLAFVIAAAPERSDSETAEAERLYRQAIAILEGETESSVDDSFRSELGRLCINLGHILSRAGRAIEAEPLLRRALALLRSAESGAAPDSGESFAILTARHDLALALRELGQLDEAETLERQAVAGLDALVVSSPEIAEYREALMAARIGLLDTHIASGKVAAAIDLARQALESGAIERRALREDPRFEVLRADPAIMALLQQEDG